MEPLSLEALSKTLPDAVKLRILGLHAAQASSSSAPPTAPAASSAAAAGSLPSTCSPAGVVAPPASSSVTIPHVTGGMAVVDGVLSVEQIQASVAAAALPVLPEHCSDLLRATSSYVMCTGSCG